MRKSPFALHVETWKNGCGSTICQPGSKVVMAKGQVPCDVLFVGEAPGASENVLGKPFCGPAGQVLDYIIQKAIRGIDKPPRMAFTNLVCCIPLGEDGKKTTEPHHEEIKACEPRLVEFVRICKPRLIVRVGKLPQRYLLGQSMFGDCDWLPESQYLKFLDFKHPAAILRESEATKGLSIQKCIVSLANAVATLDEPTQSLSGERVAEKTAPAAPTTYVEDDIPF